MNTQTMNICDHCGHEITDAETFWEETSKIIPYSYGRLEKSPLCKDVVACWRRWDEKYMAVPK